MMKELFKKSGEVLTSTKVTTFVKKSGEVLTSDKALNFAKETITETATESIKSTGRYILLIIIATILGIAGLIYLVSILF
jgi:hypothetical protein